MPLALRPLEPEDGCGGLKLGASEFAPLKAFLAHHAKPLHAANLARTSVLVEPGERTVRGYVTVMCAQVGSHEVEIEPEVESRYPYQGYPALKIGRLAVDSRYRGLGLGKRLVDFVIGRARRRVMPHIGCRIVLLDAKPSSIAFYRARGFCAVNAARGDSQATTSMYLDLQSEAN